MKIYTVEIFTDDGYELVLATHDKELAFIIEPADYDGNIAHITIWENGIKSLVKIKEIEL
jgi:hypothetical protein